MAFDFRMVGEAGTEDAFMGLIKWQIGKAFRCTILIQFSIPAYYVPVSNYYEGL